MRTDWLAQNTLYAPHKTAIIWEPTNTRLSFAACNQIGDGVAVWLQEAYGLKAGDRIAILAENTLEHLFLFFACQKAGYVLVPVNYRLSPPEVAYILHDADPKLVFFAEAFSEHTAQAPCQTLALDVLNKALAEVPPQLAPPSWPTQAPAHPVLILYTSGTTGRPKGALISHQMLLWNAVNTAMRLALTPKDISFNAAPLYHTGGWNVLLTPFLLYGATTVLLDRFDPERILRLCETEGITIVWGVPTMMKMLSDAPHFPDLDLSSVRYAIVGGEPMPIPLIEIWEAKGIPIRQGFGMTEVGPNCFSLPEEDAIRKAGSIGFPNFFIETRLVNEIGEDLAQGEIGELLMRGPVVTPGYWRNEKATSEAIKDGWFYTGDLMRMDEEGYFYVVGRKKDMYISGGENVYPAEVEAVLYQHPAVSEAAVLGIPDPRWGEVGKAFVVLKPHQSVTETALIAHCKAYLAKYKVPQAVCFMPELPKGPSGKILKKDLH